MKSTQQSFEAALRGRGGPHPAHVGMKSTQQSFEAALPAVLAAHKRDVVAFLRALDRRREIPWTPEARAGDLALVAAIRRAFEAYCAGEDDLEKPRTGSRRSAGMVGRFSEIASALTPALSRRSRGRPLSERVRERQAVLGDTAERAVQRALVAYVAIAERGLSSPDPW